MHESQINADCLNILWLDGTDLLLIEVVDSEAVGGDHDHHRDVEREQRPYHLTNGHDYS